MWKVENFWLIQKKYPVDFQNSQFELKMLVATKTASVEFTVGSLTVADMFMSVLKKSFDFLHFSIKIQKRKPISLHSDSVNSLLKLDYNYIW